MTTIITEEGPALGVALVAAVGCGAFCGIAVAWALAVCVVSRVEPDESAAAVYNRDYPLWRGLYPALKENFKAMAR